MIEVKNVSINYGDYNAVRDVSLTLPESGITALIGPNGAGKSTLLCGIGRLQEIAGGQIIIDGRPLQSWGSDELARHVAILRQENHLTMRLTVSELVMLGRYPHSKGKARPIDYEIVSRSLEQVDMTGMAGRFLDELSGGQRQRAFVAMTLAQDAKYLLLDEPLSALDMRHSRDMMRHLRKAVAEQNISVVIVIHDVNTAAAYADRLVAIKNGQNAAQGTPEEVMRSEVLQDVFNVEVDVGELGGHPIAMPRS